MSAPPPPNVKDEIARYQTDNSRYYWNLSQGTIIVSEDRVRLILLQHVTRIVAADRWIGATGVMATLIATFCTTTFRDFGLTAATWRAVFIVAALLNLAWLIQTLRQARRAPSLDDLVREIKAPPKDPSA